MKNHILQNRHHLKMIASLAGLLSFIVILPACSRAQLSPLATLRTSQTWTPRESPPTKTVGLTPSPASSPSVQAPAVTSTRTSLLIPTALRATDTPTPTEAPASETPIATEITEGGISTDWIWIAMFDERNGWGQPDRGLLITTDGGAQTWEQISPNIKMEGVWELEFVNSRTGWALRREESGKDQLYRTEDGGLTWIPLLP